MQFRLGGELGRLVEEEASKRGMSGPMLVKVIVGEWMSENYKKRMKGAKKPQNQSLVTTEGTPSDEPKIVTQ